MTRRGLGRGLDALISSTQPPDEVPIGPLPAGGSELVAVADIQPNPYQPRHSINDEELGELAASIVEHGLIQPLVVRRDSDGRGLTLIAGERRWRAARLAGLDRVPAIVRDATDQQMLALAIIENVQRSDLNPIDAAQGYQTLIDSFGLTQADVARLIGKSRPAVTNTLRLLGLTDAVRFLVASGELSEGHGRALLGIEPAGEQLRLARRAIAEGWPVRRLEQEARERSAEGSGRGDEDAGSSRASAEAAATEPVGDPNTQAAEKALEQALGTRVEIRRRGEGGLLVVHFYSEEELAALYDRLLGSG